MLGKWRDSEPCHYFEAAHLKINYDALEDFAKGFILYETKIGDLRKYPYEALFRQENWDVVFTTGDPGNTKPFSDRDRDSRRFREINGMPKFHRRDIATNLSIKLSKFRNDILQKEAKLQILKGRGKFIQLGKSGDEYWLHENSLIRILQSPFREIIVAIKLIDTSEENISRYIF